VVQAEKEPLLAVAKVMQALLAVAKALQAEKEAAGLVVEVPELAKEAEMKPEQVEVE
jgi:hypothetical protein